MQPVKKQKLTDSNSLKATKKIFKWYSETISYTLLCIFRRNKRQIKSVGIFAILLCTETKVVPAIKEK